MSYLLDYAQQKFSELRFNRWNYETSVRLIEVAPNSVVELLSNNDIFFFANAYTNGTTAISGKIIGENMAMSLTPAINQTLYYKHQFYFIAEIKITNTSCENIMYVELLVITPLQKQ